MPNSLVAPTLLSIWLPRHSGGSRNPGLRDRLKLAGGLRLDPGLRIAGVTDCKWIYGRHCTRKYWNKLKERLGKEGSQSVTNCNQLKMATDETLWNGTRKTPRDRTK